MSRVMLVLDRSGSMNHVVDGQNVFTAMQNSASTFVGMFTPGYDEMGLVVLQGSSIVAYPTTRPYNNSPTSAGGPDTSFGTSSTSGTMLTQISTMTAGGGTGTPEALALAYIELQKAHNRDLAANGADNAMNSIVLFTDGVPDSIAVYPNNPSANSLSSSSPCTYNPATATAGTQMSGWMAAPGSPPTWGTSQGLYLLSAYDTTNTLTWWLKHPTGDETTSSPSTAITNCWALGNFGGFTLDDLKQIPPTDIYGTSTNGTGYIYSSLDYNGTTYDPTKPSSGYHLALGALNATDNIGKTIRSQTAMSNVAIYTIGFTGNGGTDAGLLKRLANTQDSTSFDPTQATGMYIEVSDPSQLSAAFYEVASSLLRLKR